ncbi:interleukin-1 receptor type 1 isoform X2 [Oryzias latipes]|uniref:Zmp:0000000936 n=2 Tax=Oryzias latipes TaxID=8090 RepID=A0A3B3H3D7_ORYLA|nr:interleukin-1 receptor type 1 isoform X2 [Oryzias latipes]XP_020568992.2 interleukin-1 receptor type 1 isoform X2 [Oryzias latipes]
MDLGSTLKSILLFIWISKLCAEMSADNCTNYKLQFERVFSVPGDVAMLNSTLVSPDVFDYTTVPYNITWYNLKTGEEMSNLTHKVFVLKETLWFLNVTMEDDGEYVTILRTPSHCYTQSTKLVVETPVSGECGRPQKAYQELTKGVADTLNCPLMGYITKLHSYNISSSLRWNKGCDPIADGTDKYTYRGQTLLSFDLVDSDDDSYYTCTLTFILGGFGGSVSETIVAPVIDDTSFGPQVHQPANEIIKANKGSNFTKKCLVFVPGSGMSFVDVLWLAGDDYIFNTQPSERIYTSEQRIWTQDDPKGFWFETQLSFTELRDEDFNINYTCRAHSFRGHPEASFTLVPADPNIMLPIGCVLSGVMVLFITTVTVYYIFKVDLVLWFRRAFPVLYANKDLDGKVFDAYVAYPQHYGFGFREEVEKFALQMLPQVLEKACGYKLFIAGRDCLPGQSMVDSVEENIQASRRFLLLYTASTFISKRHTSNNNNIFKSSDESVDAESKTCESSMDLDSSSAYTDTRQHLECVAAMHRALLERSLKVVLVELEEISPDQLALFPESVQHLRKKQGAVCLWKDFKTRQKWRTLWMTREDEGPRKDSPLSASSCPSSRFWKEIRYHMPVRGKRVVYPEKTALLNV